LPAGVVPHAAEAQLGLLVEVLLPVTTVPPPDLLPVGVLLPVGEPLFDPLGVGFGAVVAVVIGTVVSVEVDGVVVAVVLLFGGVEGAPGVGAKSEVGT